MPSLPGPLPILPGMSSLSESIGYRARPLQKILPGFRGHGAYRRLPGHSGASIKQYSLPQIEFDGSQGAKIRPVVSRCGPLDLSERAVRNDVAGFDRVSLLQQVLDRL